MNRKEYKAPSLAPEGPMLEAVGKTPQEIADALVVALETQTEFPYRHCAYFYGADISGKDLSDVSLGFDDDPEDDGKSSETSWVRAANFSKVNGSGTIFDRSDLYGSLFIGASLPEATFHESDIRRVDFSSATGLTPDALRGSFYGDDTIFPEGLDPTAIPDGNKVRGYSSAYLRAQDRDPKLAEDMRNSARKWW